MSGSKSILQMRINTNSLFYLKEKKSDKNKKKEKRKKNYD